MNTSRSHATRTLGAIGAAVLVAASITLTTQPAAAVTTVHNWQTSQGGDRLTAKSDLTFAADSSAPDILVDPTRQYQAIDGFGGAFNESGWTVLNRSNVTAAQRNAVLDQLFNPSAGAGFSLTRTAMGSNDFSPTHYSYDDLAGGTDFTQANFSVAHDESTLIPYIQAAQSHGAFRIMASPWTAPGWMKDNNSLIGGGSLITPSVDPRYYQAYATYFAKYVQAYAAHGITINDVSIQNEPLNPAKFESTVYTSAQMADFIANYLGPTFASSNIGARIRGYEHNRDTWTFPVDMLNNAGTLPYVSGIDFHPYECDFGQTYCDTANLGLFNQAKPGYSTWMSEHTDLGIPNASDYPGDERWGGEIVDEILAGEGGYIYWNMVLDQTGGPFSSLSDAQEPLVIVDTSGSTATVSYMPKFYELAQFSKFVRPGAYRIGASGGANGDGIKSVAFKNPDGSEALVVVNTTGSAKTVKVGEAGSTFSRSVAAHSTNTFTWTAPVNTYHVIAGSTGTWGAVNGDHYTADSGFTGGGTAVNANAIDGSADDPLYQSERNGASFSYAFPVPTGRYRVGLKLSENFFTSAGQRVFTVSAEGAPQLSNLDIFAAAGARYKALDRSFDVTVTDGTLNLGFASSVNLAKVDAISITPIPSTGSQFTSTVSASVPAGYSTGTGTIPGYVFAQDYNTGGEGVGYHFSGAGGTDAAYRSDATHLQACTGDTYCGDNIGWLADGDWLNYTSTVNVSGTYDLHVMVANTAAGGSFSIDLDGRPWIGTQSVPNTGGYQTWQSVNINGVSIPLGTHTFTFRVGTGGFNVHSIEFSKIFQLNTSGSTAIESEWYGTGGEGFGSHDATAGNSFTAPYRGYLRGGDTDLEISSTGTFDVGNTENGEWLKYVVFNPTAKTYTLSLKAASGFSTGQVRYDLDTIGITLGTASIPNTSVGTTAGWQIFTNVPTSVTIPAGYHALYVYVVNGGFNMDSFTLS
ncbi:carbohydrate-binding protein [Leifsonia sp. 21MFCrub1.1]|uniref:carbohydrate-binding protein n=1 Tax=Leifsonia sp. 21MFCrub1.1 TaxID=1798223 RepID=UPI000892950B|nr:carbohydrate-binding protein [Leifsonia sp. 21MFCrub1.1]SEB07469.1 O-Glycosyl hydrolase [Leifsonia sp. 21MFCrub1.1]